MVLENLLNTTEKISGGEAESKQIADKIKGVILSGKLAANTKLQPEKKLAASYSTTMHVIRKAVKLLKEERFLYSRPKFGVFVSPALDYEHGVPKSEPEPMNLSLHSSPEHRIRFYTHSCLPKQQVLFSVAVDEFTAQYPFCKISVIKATDNAIPEEIPEKNADVIDTGIPLQYHTKRHLYMDINEYFPKVLKISQKDPTIVPFYYSTTYLCYNSRLLKDIGCSVPSYQNFEEQSAYLNEVGKQVADYSMMPAGTCFSLLHLLGKTLSSIFADIRDENVSEKDFLDRHLSDVSRCIGVWGHSNISSHLLPQRLKAFVEKATPILFADTSNVLGIRDRHPDLDFDMYPILSLDNQLPRLTVQLSVNKMTACPVECIRFLHCLQGETVQKKAAELGFIPLEKEYYSMLPGASNLRAEGGEELLFTTDEDCYIGSNILDAELWNIIQSDKSAEEALKETLSLARSYLKLQRNANPKFSEKALSVS